MTLKDRLTALREELVCHKFWKAVRCEFLSTLLYVFIGCGSSIGDRSSTERVLVVAFAFGLAEATFVQCVGHISGAHLNPAISIAMLVTRNISPIRATCYVFAQCVGAIAGAGILYGLTPSLHQGSLGVTRVMNNVQNGQAFGIEFMITFVVVFTFFANLEQKRTDMGSRSLSIGLSVTLGHLFAVS